MLTSDSLTNQGETGKGGHEGRTGCAVRHTPDTARPRALRPGPSGPRCSPPGTAPNSHERSERSRDSAGTGKSCSVFFRPHTVSVCAGPLSELQGGPPPRGTKPPVSQAEGVPPAHLCLLCPDAVGGVATSVSARGSKHRRSGPRVPDVGTTG